jgi:ketosteroid isomerase-like protein
LTSQTLEERVQRLEDLEAIKDLVYRWAFYVNKGWNGMIADIDALSLIYTEDVSGGMPQMDSHVEGLEQVKKDLAADTADIIVSMHSMTNPVIDLEGDMAKGNWLMRIYVHRENGTRQLFMSVDHDYVRTNQGWRIKKGYIYIAGMLEAEAGFTP